MDGSRHGEGDGPERAGVDPSSRLANVVRLKKRAEFLRVARGGRAHGRAMTLQSQGRDGEGSLGAVPRFGFTVTKKVGDAVERNRIRRRLREALRVPGLAIEASHDYVLVARRDALTMRFGDLVADLAGALRQARRRRGAGRPRGAVPPTSGR